MADYDWGCPRCQRLGGHEEDCSKHPHYKTYVENLANGWKRKGDFWMCMRGCGLVVWNKGEHRQWCE